MCSKDLWNVSYTEIKLTLKIHHLCSDFLFIYEGNQDEKTRAIYTMQIVLINQMRIFLLFHDQETINIIVSKHKYDTFFIPHIIIIF